MLWHTILPNEFNGLFTSATGEWFQKRAVNHLAVEREGARRVAEHADLFLPIVVREARSGPKRFRPAVCFKFFPAAWLANAVRDAVFVPLPDAQELLVRFADDVSAMGKGLLEFLDWALESRRERLSLPPVKASSSDPLFMFRAR